MKIIHLARDLKVEPEALLFFAQSNGIEAQSIAKSITSEEAEILINAFEEQEQSKAVAQKENVDNISSKVSLLGETEKSQREIETDKAVSKDKKPLRKGTFLFKNSKKEKSSPKIKTRKKFSLYQNKKISPKMTIWLVRGFLLFIFSLTAIENICRNIRGQL